MTTDVQQRIDQLGERLHRSVVLNDASIRLLYSSKHYGDEDPVRIRAALHRDAGSQAIAHLLAQGITRWTAAGRIPAAPDFGLQARLLVPVRWHGEMLGYVVVIDAQETLTPDEVSLIEDFAREVAGLIMAERHSADQRTRTDDEDTEAWLGRDPLARARGMEGLASRGVLPDSAHVRVLVVEPVPTPATDETGTHVALRHSVDVVRSRMRGTALARVAGGRMSLAMVSPSPLDAEKVHQAAGLVRDEVRDFLGSRVTRVGVGDEVAGVDRAWLSCRQAELALRGAAVLAPDGICFWEDLGALQLLLRIPDDELDETAVPEPVFALLAADPQGRLVETLEAYLSAGGAGSAAAKVLHIHRTTLYYRLDRVREVTGLDLDDGRTRTTLQLGLATHRLLRAREVL